MCSGRWSHQRTTWRNCCSSWTVSWLPSLHRRQLSAKVSQYSLELLHTSAPVRSLMSLFYCFCSQRKPRILRVFPSSGSASGWTTPTSTDWVSAGLGQQWDWPQGSVDSVCNQKSKRGKNVTAISDIKQTSRHNLCRCGWGRFYKNFVQWLKMLQDLLLRGILLFWNL